MDMNGAVRPGFSSWMPRIDSAELVKAVGPGARPDVEAETPKP